MRGGIVDAASLRPAAARQLSASARSVRKQAARRLGALHRRRAAACRRPDQRRARRLWRDGAGADAGARGRDGARRQGRSMTRRSPPRRRVATEGCAPLSDPQASAWYRLNVLPVHLARLLRGRRRRARWRAFRSSSPSTARSRPSSSSPARLLLDVLRDKLGLTGDQVRLRPGHLRRLHRHHRRRAAALLPDPRRSACEGRIGRRRSKASRTTATLHPLQRAFAEGFAAQCGFCTPGMIIAAKALLDRNPASEPRRGRSTRSPATSAAAPAMSRSSTPSSPPPADMRGAKASA